jgi:hypothetical protein
MILQRAPCTSLARRTYNLKKGARTLQKTPYKDDLERNQRQGCLRHHPPASSRRHRRGTRARSSKAPYRRKTPANGRRQATGDETTWSPDADEPPPQKRERPPRRRLSSSRHIGQRSQRQSWTLCVPLGGSTIHSTLQARAAADPSRKSMCRRSPHHHHGRA